MCAPCVENEPQPELVAQLAQEMYSNDMLQAMVVNMWRFEFEVSRISRPGIKVVSRFTGWSMLLA